MGDPPPKVACKCGKISDFRVIQLTFLDADDTGGFINYFGHEPPGEHRPILFNELDRVIHLDAIKCDYGIALIDPDISRIQTAFHSGGNDFPLGEGGYGGTTHGVIDRESIHHEVLALSDLDSPGKLVAQHDNPMGIDGKVACSGNVNMRRSSRCGNHPVDPGGDGYFIGPAADRLIDQIARQIVSSVRRNAPVKVGVFFIGNPLRKTKMTTKDNRHEQHGHMHASLTKSMDLVFHNFILARQ